MDALDWIACERVTLGGERITNSKGTLDRFVMIGGTGALAVKGSSAAVVLVANVLVARFLGVNSYGAFSFVMSITVILGGTATFGFNTLLVRETARTATDEHWDRFFELRRAANWTTGIFSAVLVLVLLAVVGVVRGSLEPEVRDAFWTGVGLIPLIAYLQLRQETLRGLGFVVRSQIPDLLIRPVLLVTGFLALRAAYGFPTTAAGTLFIATFAAAVALGVSALWLRRKTPRREHLLGTDLIRTWLPLGLPLMGLTLMRSLDVHGYLTLLGFLSTPTEVGQYAAAARIAQVVGFALLAASAALAPAIVRFHAAGDVDALQSLVTKTTRVVFAVALAIGLPLLVFGRNILAVFGGDFLGAHSALIVLVLAQVGSAGTGLVGLLLVMTGYERDPLGSLLIANTIGLALCAILAPIAGGIGAAIASATGTMLWNVLLAFRVHRRLGIHATVLGAVGGRRSG